jgi:YD repeat-containing protein
VTKRVLLSFTYDTRGRLTEVADADSNVTRLERNGSGDLTAIVGPFGQRTTVGLDARGWLARLVNPAGDTTRVQHDSTGLLVSWTEPRENPPHLFVYDSLGLLTRDEGPGGGFTTISRVMNDSSVTASLTTAMGRVTRSGQTLRSTGVVERTFTDAANLLTLTVEATNGTTAVTAPDSSAATVTEKSDPRFGMQAPIASDFAVPLEIRQLRCVDPRARVAIAEERHGPRRGLVRHQRVRL